jgi:hypothetical protein
MNHAGKLAGDTDRERDSAQNQRPAGNRIVPHEFSEEFDWGCGYRPRIISNNSPHKSSAAKQYCVSGAYKNKAS